MVNETILKNKLNEGVTQAGALKKTYQPITTKLDDVALTNLKIPHLRQKKKVRQVPDYGLNLLLKMMVISKELMDWKIFLMKRLSYLFSKTDRNNNIHVCTSQALVTSDNLRDLPFAVLCSSSKVHLRRNFLGIYASKGRHKHPLPLF